MKTFAFFILFPVFFCFSQNTLFSTRIANAVSANITSDYLTVYNGTSLGIGAQINGTGGSLSILSVYQFGGSLVSNGLKPYLMQNHFVGGTIQYRILSESKSISPVVEMTALTEIASNYRGGYIKDYGPQKFPSAYWTSYGNGLQIDYYHSDYYISTPMIGNLLIGCDFRIINGLNINVALGYGYRIMKIRYKQWHPDEQEPWADLSGKYNLKDGDLLHCVDFQIGLNYTLSVKKKTKNI
ncbi:MAG: hypothetical protein J0G96_04330 [Flavobacteriia bacterium]|nr:hypothetical protein [Flavobacteriia bacterium]OJX36998.1 MAG: hypothetical protein BGO87_14560 [Flavobacteriia bacterium 40-80]